MYYARPASRSFLGVIAPSATLMASVVLPVVVGIVQQHKGTFDPMTMVTLAISGFLSAVLVNCLIRKQLYLARNGVETTAIIDVVTRIKSDYHMARYSFKTIDGHWVHAKCTIGGVDAVALEPGTETVVFYDAEKPSRSLIINSMWAVRWED